MNHVFELSSEQYKKLAAYAEQQEQTPENLVHMWIDEMINQIQGLNAPNAEEQMDEQELLAKHPILQVSGMFAIDVSGWSDKHDEYLAEAYADNHDDE